MEGAKEDGRGELKKMKGEAKEDGRGELKKMEGGS